MQHRRSAVPIGVAAAALACLLDHGAMAQPADSGAHGIYVCEDAEGRHISSDRQISACRDQSQRVLDASGTTRKVLTPEVSPLEQREQRERRRAQALADFQRRNRERADNELLLRYPTLAAHEQARREALEQPQIIIRLAQERIADLDDQRAGLRQREAAQTAAFAAPPPKLAAELQANEQAIAAQRRLIEEQGAKRVEINQRFDDEAARLLAIRRAQKLPSQ